MELINKRDFGTRRCLFAVAIFFGMNIATCQADDSQAEDDTEISSEVTSEITEGVDEEEDTSSEIQDDDKNSDTKDDNGSRRNRNYR